MVDVARVFGVLNDFATTAESAVTLCCMGASSGSDAHEASAQASIRLITALLPVARAIAPLCKPIRLFFFNFFPRRDFSNVAATLIPYSIISMKAWRRCKHEARRDAGQCLHAANQHFQPLLSFAASMLRQDAVPIIYKRVATASRKPLTTDCSGVACCLTE